MKDTEGVEICQIPGNPDIAGIGVRGSVYAQACLAGFNLLYVFYYLLKTQPPGHSDVELQLLGMSAPSIHAPTEVLEPTDPPSLLGASIQPPEISYPPSTHVSATSNSPQTNPPSLHQHQPSSPHHTAAPRDKKKTSKYQNLAKTTERSLFLIGFSVLISAIQQAKSSTGLTQYHGNIVITISQITQWGGFVVLASRALITSTSGGRPWRGVVPMTREYFLFDPTFILYLLHAALMAGLSIYFWDHEEPFLSYGASAPQQPCHALTILYGPNEFFDELDKSIRRSWIAVDSLSLIVILGGPVSGFILMVNPTFIFAIIGSLPLIRPRLLRRIPLVYKLRGAFTSVMRLLRLVLRVLSLLEFLHGGSARVALSSITFYYTLGVVYYVFYTELTIRANSLIVEPGVEAEWSYGQTLALMTTLVTISMYVYELHTIATKKKRRSTRR